MINPHRKILGSLVMAGRVLENQTLSRSIILATGCFDLLHRGHVQLLVRSKLATNNPSAAVLAVGINSDESIRELKGKRRPVCPLADRLYMLAAIECVDVVFYFNDLNAARAIRTIKPAIWIKGGDWKLSSLAPAERRAVKEVGAVIKILPRCGDWSTSGILKRL